MKSYGRNVQHMIVFQLYSVASQFFGKFKNNYMIWHHLLTATLLLYPEHLVLWCSSLF